MHSLYFNLCSLHNRYTIHGIQLKIHLKCKILLLRAEQLKVIFIETSRHQILNNIKCMNIKHHN